jgi:protoporphyrinogen oxidase
MENIDIVILGAGIAGLGAALRARELGRTAVVFEKSRRAGGLLDNFTIDGYRFDRAVHLSFASEPKVREIFDRTPYITHPADSMCFEELRWLKHPVQNNLFPLPAQEKVNLIESFVQREEELVGDDYESWLRHQYGDGIAERYPMRYTRKYWATEANALSTTWIGNRMRRAELGEILYGAFTSDTPNTYYTKEMRYPEKGGFRSFIEPLIADADIRCDHEVTAVDPVARTVSFANGTTVCYQHLVSSLPLPVLVRLMPDAPVPVSGAARSLKATSVDLVSVGFRRQVVKDLWFYIYDEDILASRAYSPSVKSPDNVPAGCSSLQFEIYNRGESSPHTTETLLENIRYALRKMNIGTPDDIAFMDHRTLNFGNVIFDRGMEAQRKVVLDYLEHIQIKSCGRFGAWEYFWSNQSFLSGYQSVGDL